jgi:hypothetical protein
VPFKRSTAHMRSTCTKGSTVTPEARVVIEARLESWSLLLVDGGNQDVEPPAGVRCEKHALRTRTKQRFPTTALPATGGESGIHNRNLPTPAGVLGAPDALGFGPSPHAIISAVKEREYAQDSHEIDWRRPH